MVMVPSRKLGFSFLPLAESLVSQLSWFMLRVGLQQFLPREGTGEMNHQEVLIRGKMGWTFVPGGPLDPSGWLEGE